MRDNESMNITKVPLELEDWFDSLNQYLPASDITDIKRAYELATSAHTGQTRASGEPYITHSITVAQMLSDLKLEGEVIIAGLLHDVPEDTQVTLKEIEQDFGPMVSKLVDGVTKLKQASDFTGLQGQSRSKEEQQTENLRKMFLAIGDDVRVVLIKLADRLHNVRTLGSLSEHKRRRIARETLDIFAPLANRLGMDTIKSELEDQAFRYLYPRQYQNIARKLAANRSQREKYIAKIADELKTALDEAHIEVRLLWRTKHLYSIYQKIQRKEVDINQIYDVTALRVIVKSVRDCYAALGVVHTKWRPIPREFDDYIAAPKENGYQSLHTAVINQKGQQFEVQIRTEEMHRQAELGIAAHWRYKDGAKVSFALDQKIAAMRHAIKLQTDSNDASEFVNAVKTDVIEEKVYVFTPKGDIVELPLGSTPIDFAYYIHTQVGHKCRGAKVNGSLVGLDYQLKNGDKVEILTAKRGGPSRDWLNENLGYIKSSRARKKVRHWFKRQNYQESIAQGRSILDRELKRLHITDVKLDDLAVACGYQKTDDFLAAVGYNDISIHQIIRKSLRLTAIGKEPPEKLEFVPTSIPSPAPTDGVTVQGVSDLLTTFARCCRPVPGDPIVGYITRGRGVTIHRHDCSNVIRAIDRDRLIEVSWGTKDQQTYPVAIVVQAFDRRGLMRDISEVIANERINITNVSVSVKNHIASVSITLEVTDLSQLKKVMDKTEQLPNIIEVVRKR
jgi:GTP pyrophosphokinase